MQPLYGSLGANGWYLARLARPPPSDCSHTFRGGGFTPFGVDTSGGRDKRYEVFNTCLSGGKWAKFASPCLKCTTTRRERNSTSNIEDTPPIIHANYSAAQIGTSFALPTDVLHKHLNRATRWMTPAAGPSSYTGQRRSGMH